MSTSVQLSPLARLLIIGACIVILLAAIHAVAYLVNPILLAFIITLVCTPFLHWLQSKGVPTALAVVIVLLIVVTTGLALIGFVGVSLSQLEERLPVYEAGLAELEATVMAWLEGLGIDASGLLTVDALEPDAVVQFAVDVLLAVGQALSDSLLTLSIVSFMMVESAIFPDKLRQALGSRYTASGLFAVHSKGVRDYVLSRTVTGLATGVANTALLLILGVDFAFLWGLWSILMRLIPNVGILLAIIPPFLLALLQYGLSTALIVFVGYWLADSLVNTLVAAKFMPHRLRLSPLVAFLSLLLWGWVLGAVGALLAAPLTHLLMFALASQEDTRWLAVMLSAGDDSDTTAATDANEEATTES